MLVEARPGHGQKNQAPFLDAW